MGIIGLHLAILRNVKCYNAQIVREANAVGPQDAACLSAEINIADGKGTIYDQVKYIRNYAEKCGEKLGKEAALRIGSRGQAAHDIGLLASPALYDSFINQQITPEAAEAIAQAAPSDEAAQRIGIRAAKDGKSVSFVANLIKAVAVEKRGATSQEIDLFGNDDGAMKAMRAHAQRACELQEAVRQRIQVLRGAGRRPEVAAIEGIDVDDPASVENRLKMHKARLTRLENWPLHPELVAKIKSGKAMDIAQAVATRAE